MVSIRSEAASTSWGTMRLGSPPARPAHPPPRRSAGRASLEPRETGPASPVVPGPTRTVLSRSPSPALPAMPTVPGDCPVSPTGSRHSATTMAGTTTVALPVSASWKTVLAAILRRSGDRRYHQRAWVSATNRLRLTIDLPGRPVGQPLPGLPDALDVLEVLVASVGQLGERASQRG